MAPGGAAVERQYSSELGRVLAEALLDGLPRLAVGTAGQEGEDAAATAAMHQFVVPLGSGAVSPGAGAWRDLDSAGLRAARRAGEARAARKAAALGRVRAGDAFVDMVLTRAGGEAQT